jgi:betaine-aldehyde dehydrogenase
MTTEIRAARHFIDGEFVDSVDGETMAVLNPATGEPFALAAVASAEDVDRAVRAARRAFDGWSATVPWKRAETLNLLADAVVRSIDEFVGLEVDNVGKPVSAFHGDETPWIIDLMRYYAGAARHMRGGNSGEYDSYDDETSYMSVVRREPIGVIGQITPAAFPTLMAVWKIFPALAAGNTVVFKPAEQTPTPALKLAELASELLPIGVLNVIAGTADAGRALVTHDDVDMVSLTGSSESGRWITRNAGLKRLNLGLGNQPPAIIFEDADLEPTLARIAQTGFYNAGQDCASTSRVLASAAIYDDVVNGLVSLAKGMVTGDLRAPGTNLGPMIAESYRERVEGFLDRRPDHAELLTGGRRPEQPGFYLEPAVVTGLRQTDEMIQQEVYGAVITVQPFTSEEEAIAMANGTPYGLTGSVWTNDLRRALRCVRRLKLGNVNVNETSKLVTEKPFGGIKQSGYGQDVGIEALEGYTQIKTVCLLSP